VLPPENFRLSVHVADSRPFFVPTRRLSLPCWLVTRALTSYSNIAGSTCRFFILPNRHLSFIHGLARTASCRYPLLTSTTRNASQQETLPMFSEQRKQKKVWSASVYIYAAGPILLRFSVPIIALEHMDGPLSFWVDPAGKKKKQLHLKPHVLASKYIQLHSLATRRSTCRQNILSDHHVHPTCRDFEAKGSA
jgi:hypothetical protein